MKPRKIFSLRRRMQQQLPESIKQLLHTIGAVADSAAMPAYVVGGFVRDLLLGLENSDLDIMVEGDGIAFASLLAKRLKGKLRVHAKFGTAQLLLKQGGKIDIATARKECYAHPAALPQVKAASLKLDLARRDFSINAMAIRINLGEFGKLVDFFNSFSDLQQGLIRVLYPLSFVDDPTRIFRAIRFEQRLGFSLEANTARFIQEAAKRNLVSGLSHSRLWGELILILSEERAVKIIRRLEKLKLLSWIHSNRQKIKVLQPLFNGLRESIAFAGLCLDEPVNRIALYLMALFYGFELAQLRVILKNLQMPYQVRKLLVFQKQRSRLALNRLIRPKQLSASQISEVLHGFPIEVLLFMLATAGKTPALKRIRDYVTKWRTIRARLNGNDLKKLGYIPSPRFEQMLQLLRNARMDNLVLTRQDEIKLLRKNYPLEKKPICRQK